MKRRYIYQDDDLEGIEVFRFKDSDSTNDQESKENTPPEPV